LEKPERTSYRGRPALEIDPIPTALLQHVQALEKLGVTEGTLAMRR
jgi:hypothetical protein